LVPSLDGETADTGIDVFWDSKTLVAGEDMGSAELKRSTPRAKPTPVIPTAASLATSASRDQTGPAVTWRVFAERPAGTFIVCASLRLPPARSAAVAHETPRDVIALFFFLKI
jgi:hypothetical protein